MSRALSHEEHHGPRKRRRVVVSCTECHRRKQKCDRQCPCCHCIRRGTQDLCCYDQVSKSRPSKLSESLHIDPPDLSNGASEVQANSCGSLAAGQDRHEITNTLRDLGYSSQDKYNSLTILRATETYGCQNDSPIDWFDRERSSTRSDTRLKYTSLVRRLPSQASLDTLVQTYFTSVNWQYDLLDQNMFQEQLESWRKVTYSDLQKDLTAFAPGTLAFPALLFQVLAQALLFHSPLDQTISGLLTIPDMTFHDLAEEYNSTGAGLLRLLGKEALATTTVQAGLLNASFMKSTGKVVEAWHALGATIRDAQEVGLHTGQDTHEQHLSTKGEAQRWRLVGHKLWMILHIWDAHMAVVLGRPMATNLRLHDFAQNIIDDEERRELLLHWQTEEETPRPFDVIMAGYTVAYRYFQDIHELEHRNITPQHNLTVENIHAAITRNMTLLPSWCRLDSPNAKFDAACPWLPAAREGLCSLIYLVILTLHRPHIFSKSNSRTEALKAGVSILHAQERLFRRSEPHHLHLFTPVYASFDAIVLVATISLVFPDEIRAEQAHYIQVERGVRRLEIVGQYNCVARSAHNIASSLYLRLKQRSGIPESTNSTAEASSSSVQLTSGSYADSFNSTIRDLNSKAIAPPHPTHDFFYDHLSTAHTSSSINQNEILADTSIADTPENWNFEGAFSDHSFWGFLNETDSFT